MALAMNVFRYIQYTHTHAHNRKHKHKHLLSEPFKYIPLHKSNLIRLTFTLWISSSLLLLLLYRWHRSYIDSVSLFLHSWISIWWKPCNDSTVEQRNMYKYTFNPIKHMLFHMAHWKYAYKTRSAYPPIRRGIVGKKCTVFMDQYQLAIIQMQTAMLPTQSAHTE